MDGMYSDEFGVGGMGEYEGCPEGICPFLNIREPLVWP